MEFLKRLHIEKDNPGTSTGCEVFDVVGREKLLVYSPVDGNLIARVYLSSSSDYERVVRQSLLAFHQWRLIPAPKRGEIIRQICTIIRENKNDLAALISYEMGKSLQEGLGEVQEMIDMGDFVVGQSRMLYGSTTHSERSQHRLYDQYHPLGVVGVITAFNFPVAVWAWNAFLAAVCGDVIIWKPSSKTPLCAIAIQKIISQTLSENALPEGIFSLIIGGGKEIGEKIINDDRISLISFTGSVKTGRHVGRCVAGRMGKSLLELGGNNAIIITGKCNLEITISALVFGAIGTSGQRCTTTRRLIVAGDIYEKIKKGLLAAYGALKIGSSMEPENHMGPLVDTRAVKGFLEALDDVKKQGGKILCGGKILTGSGFESGCYVSPALVEASPDMEIVQQETFAPILYIMRYPADDLQAAISIQNGVKQGLSSAIFTDDLREAEFFLSVVGSDCGIANVNIGTSGAEIGGAFGGEKETGGGREAGSDAWKGYMRRQTVTVNYGYDQALSQGIKFDIPCS